MLFFGQTPIVLVDGHEFRRVAFANLLAPLLIERNVLFLQWNSIDSINSPQSSYVLSQSSAPLFVLNAGLLGLTNPRLAEDITRLRRVVPNCLVLVMMETEWKGEIDLAMALGISGVISTSMPPRNAIAAIEVALIGGTYFPQVVSRTTTAVPANSTSPAAAQTETEAKVEQTPPSYETAIREKLWGGDPPAPTSDLLHLSNRQMDVLRTLQSGMSNKEIARALGLSEATVKIHVRHLMRKFGAGNRTQVAVLSRHQGDLGRAN